MNSRRKYERLASTCLSLSSQDSRDATPLLLRGNLRRCALAPHFGSHSMSTADALDLMLFVVLSQTADGCVVSQQTYLAVKFISHVLCETDRVAGARLTREMVSCGFDFGPNMEFIHQRLTSMPSRTPSVIDRICHHAKELASSTGSRPADARLEVWNEIYKTMMHGASSYRPIGADQFRTDMQELVPRHVLQEYVDTVCCTKKGGETRVVRNRKGGSSIVHLSDAKEATKRTGIFHSPATAIQFFRRVGRRVELRGLSEADSDVIAFFRVSV